MEFHPADTTIRFGRNPTSYRCPANMHMRGVVHAKLSAYRLAVARRQRKVKGQILHDVLERLSSEGYNFAKQTSSSGTIHLYREATKAECIGKIGHLFRDMIEAEDRRGEQPPTGNPPVPPPVVEVETEQHAGQRAGETEVVDDDLDRGQSQTNNTEDTDAQEAGAAATSQVVTNETEERRSEVGPCTTGETDVGEAASVWWLDGIEPSQLDENLLKDPLLGEWDDLLDGWEEV